MKILEKLPLCRKSRATSYDTEVDTSYTLKETLQTE
jgi:hypothetical protein